MTVRLGPLGDQTVLGAGLIAIGAVVVMSSAFTLLRVLLSIFVLPGKSLRSFGPPGTWAVITGASDGIGKEYAIQLGRKGYNLVLVSRTAAKLSALRDQILSSNSKLTIETLSIDFSQPTEESYQALTKLLQNKQVSILINNVGQSHAIPVPFIDTSISEMTSIVQINTLATLRVTQLVLPFMLPQRRGLILTMGSFGGLIPTPLLATYSGSKAFLQQWSDALASELSSKGITVHFVHAHLITSGMSKIRRASLAVPSEKAFVKAALGKIGRRGGSVGFPYSGSPYWAHALLAAIITGVLGCHNSLLLQYNRGMHVGIRKRALAKAEREKAKGKKAS